MMLSTMMRGVPVLLGGTLAVAGEIRVPGATAYSLPDAGAMRTSESQGVLRSWSDPAQQAVWYGKFGRAGEVKARVLVKVPDGSPGVRLRLTVAGRSAEAAVQPAAGQGVADFGAFAIPAPGFHALTLTSLQPKGTPTGDVAALVLDGPATEGVHFNLKPRRNAASVHLSYQTPAGAAVTGFYNEVTAVDDPTATFYMACGFSRGYLGMQVNSPTERRLIFSVWDAAEGGSADRRDTVKEENHTKLLAKGEGVHASVFGGEGTGGHSHLKYPWRTGDTQRFWLTCRPEGTHTDYTGWWFRPDKKEWFMLASFRAPKDGKALRGLYSFSENFDGASGHVRRKALFGPQWLRLADGSWSEITQASFSHDATGRGDRVDRFMGVEGGRFFLSHGGFVDGFTTFGERFARPAAGTPPADLPR